MLPAAPAPHPASPPTPAVPGVPQAAVTAGSGAAPADPLAGTGEAALPSYIEQIERETIRKALEQNRYNKTKTAAQLGITFRALRYKLKKLGID